jgi:hypothetical protein
MEGRDEGRLILGFDDVEFVEVCALEFSMITVPKPICCPSAPIHNVRYCWPSYVWMLKSKQFPMLESAHTSSPLDL